MAQALHFDLAGVGEGALVDQATDADQVFLLVGVADLAFQLVADVEVVFQGALATTGDNGNLIQPSFQRFFNAVLDQWLVHHRQHFLGHGFSRWQEASTVTGCWEQAFLDHISPCNGCVYEFRRSLIRRRVPYNAPRWLTDANIEKYSCR
ncbi:hypothetical protein D9M73_199130 [compost metagenome]